MTQTQSLSFQRKTLLEIKTTCYFLTNLDITLSILYYNFVVKSIIIFRKMSLTPKEYDQMELSYENLKNNPKTLLAFTGFDVGEFQILLKAFTIAWEKYVQQHRLPLEIRQRGYGGGRKSQLPTNERGIEYLGSTWEGKKHGKIICEYHEFLERSILYKDTGYQGYEPSGVDTRQPKKKPRNGELN